MNKLRINDITLIVILGLVFIASLIGIFLIYSQLSDKNVHLKQLQTEIRTLENEIRKLPEMRIKAEQMETEEKRLATFIPSKEGQAEFVWELEDLAHQSNIQIDNCNIVPQVTSLSGLSQYYVYQWKIGLSGSYAGLIAFMKGLTSGGRAAMVANLNIGSLPPTDKNEDKKYVLNINMGLDLISSPVRERVAK